MDMMEISKEALLKSIAHAEASGTRDFEDVKRELLDLK